MILAVIVLFLLIFGFSLSGKYNTLVQLDEGVQTAWSQVENVYQRRMDLLPNLVATVKGEAAFEQETLTQVTEARASATKMTVDVKDSQAMAEFQAQQGGISQALGRLLVASENYPNLKANQAFSDLRVQLEGTENRITTERMNYNTTAQKYNTTIRSFPTNLIAKMFGFEKANLFEANEGAEKAPVVDFTN
ncbi:MAG: LemA family protein [Candidatus Peribacteria bacterium]|nr:LemA family protein [Candidatus Peribacteria bacterium]